MTQATMTETAATPTEAASPSTAPESVAATADKLYGNTQKAPATQDRQAADAAPAGKEPAPADAQATEAPQAEAPKAPEAYEFKVPEGRAFDAEVITAYSQVARELNLSQDAAQRLLDAVGPKMVERQTAQIEAIRNGWADSSKSDREFGGEKLSENLGVAKKALDAFGTAELRTLLNETGLGNHPELIRFMFRAGKAISEDRMVT
ncbi:MAG: hypothetical protein ACOVKC_05195, partial [Brevundimonas sp.]